MKTLILSLMLILSANAFAKDSCEIDVVSTVDTKEDVNTPTPKELEGATILVKTKDGKVREMKSSEFKVVPRKQQLKVKKQVITQNVNCKPIEVEKQVLKKQVLKKNIISLTVVRSLGDYTLSSGPGYYQVQNEYSPAVGLMYQRNIFDSVYLGIQADTHKSIGGSIGIGF